MNNLNSLIKKLMSRSVTKIFEKKFEFRDSVENKIEEIFNLAPTSFGLQPFKIIKISGKKDREAVKSVSWGQKQVVDSSLLYIFAVETDVEMVLKRYENLLFNIRKVGIKEAAEYSKFVRAFLLKEKKDGNSYEFWATKQIYLVLGFFLSMAAILDIDATPMEGFDPKKIEKIFNLKKKLLSPKILLCVGKRSRFDKYCKMTKVRKPKSDLMLYI